MFLFGKSEKKEILVLCSIKTALTWILQCIIANMWVRMLNRLFYGCQEKWIKIKAYPGKWKSKWKAADIVCYICVCGFGCGNNKTQRKMSIKERFLCFLIISLISIAFCVYKIIVTDSHCIFFFFWTNEWSERRFDRNVWHQRILLQWMRKAMLLSLAYSLWIQWMKS